jgi:hypothetical protein
LGKVLEDLEGFFLELQHFLLGILQTVFVFDELDNFLNAFFIFVMVFNRIDSPTLFFIRTIVQGMN